MPLPAMYLIIFILSANGSTVKEIEFTDSIKCNDAITQLANDLRDSGQHVFTKIGYASTDEPKVPVITLNCVER